MRKIIPFRATPWKQGGSTVITVPAQYVSNGLIPEDKELLITVEVDE